MSRLNALERDVTLRERLGAIHHSMRQVLPHLTRIAIARYCPNTDTLTTFIDSTETSSEIVVPFCHYGARLADVPSLTDLATSHRDRVIDDLSSASLSSTLHNRILATSGYRSSYTRPFYDRGALAGFMFFDSAREAYFAADVVDDVDVYCYLLAAIVTGEMTRAREISTAVQVAKQCGGLHDAETGAHLERMANYSRLIATQLAKTLRPGLIDDEFVEFVFLFSPLHDIGKLTIPDAILHKTVGLDADEMARMRQHSELGYHFVATISERIGLNKGLRDILLPIVRNHHEAFDGSGYPDHLVGETIPLPARIVAVADVFDALTSKRPYKTAWSTDEAIVFLQQNAGRKFDPDCVNALIAARAEVEQIQARFANEINGDDPAVLH